MKVEGTCQILESTKYPSLYNYIVHRAPLRLQVQAARTLYLQNLCFKCQKKKKYRPCGKGGVGAREKDIVYIIYYKVSFFNNVY